MFQFKAVLIFNTASFN